MENLKDNIENNKENQKTSVFPTVEQIINDLQFQLSNIKSNENKMSKSNDILETIKEISNITESEKIKYNKHESIQAIIKEKEIIANEKGKAQIERNAELDNQINTVLDNFININESLKEYKDVINNSDNVISDLNVNINNIISNINNEINEIKANQ
ncbi:hypothetical protein PIROE2DRAFT_3095 [Piromyces sp. E2]|nr:hypothetical protein PIROE2DRAFT_3095 [Piromyces sp. E2]|eukprot:OUM69035.1 hypothetical protein PIROE2DRAFT_3095 [Piromyces sp. E2]